MDKDKFYAIMAVVVAICIVLILTLPDNPSSASRAPDGYDAWYKCKNDVLSQLKAPSTASFQRFSDNDAKTTLRNEDTLHFDVTVTVDAQNSFGAMLRKGYDCQVIFEYTIGEEWVGWVEQVNPR